MLEIAKFLETTFIIYACHMTRSMANKKNLSWLNFEINGVWFEEPYDP